MSIPLDLVTMERAVEICLARMDGTGNRPLRVITLNPEMVMYARRDPAFSACFEGDTLVVPDGTGIMLACLRRGWREVRRVPGVELCQRLAAEAARRSLPVFLYGGEPGVAELAARALGERYPDLIVGGTAHGFLSQAELAGLPARIAASEAKLVFAGLGVPRQEYWLLRNLERTGAAVGMGVGGSFDVLSGRTRRAPQIMRRLGIEWLYRVLREPRRLIRLRVMPGYIWLALKPEARRRCSE